ncbi:MAG: MlaD family protein, partial [Deltaproteobacteria bacterium]
MKKASVEAVVGVFMLVGILSLAYLSIRLGKLELMGGDFYDLSATFNSVSGLKSGASVEIAGVEIGRVDRIEL